MVPLLQNLRGGPRTEPSPNPLLLLNSVWHPSMECSLGRHPLFTSRCSFPLSSHGDGGHCFLRLHYSFEAAFLREVALTSILAAWDCCFHVGLWLLDFTLRNVIYISKQTSRNRVTQLYSLKITNILENIYSILLIGYIFFEYKNEISLERKIYVPQKNNFVSCLRKILHSSM